MRSERKLRCYFEPRDRLFAGVLLRACVVLGWGASFGCSGPSIEVLLSRAFQDAHCFALRRDRRRERIGLTFEPLPGGRLSDIEGVLWLAEATGELRTLEFSYVRLPSSVPRGRYEGSAGFRRLEDGAWIIDQWRLSALDMHDPMRIRERTGQLLDVRRLR